MYDEGEMEDEFRVGAEGDEPLDIPDMMGEDFGLDEEDPDKDR